jgi:CRISPR-associated endonuclease/helicase Cas3
LAQPDSRAAEPHTPQPDTAQRGGEHGGGGRAGGRGHADTGAGAPLARGRETGTVETRLGSLSRADLAPHIGRNLLALEARIESGEFAAAPLTPTLLLDFHHVICGDIVPQLAGWRRTNPVVGGHLPPDCAEVPALVLQYMDALAKRIAETQMPDERLLETLAYAEGRLLSIHPVARFNGRLVSAWLREILRRLDLPPVQLASVESAARAEYLRALNALEDGDSQPLMRVWQARFEALPL